MQNSVKSAEDENIIDMPGVYKTSMVRMFEMTDEPENESCCSMWLSKWVPMKDHIML